MIIYSIGVCGICYIFWGKSIHRNACYLVSFSFLWICCTTEQKEERLTFFGCAACFTAFSFMGKHDLVKTNSHGFSARS